MRMASRRRTIVRSVVSRVCVFLLLGAIVNVAVGWGCSVWTPLDHQNIEPDVSFARLVLVQRGYEVDDDEPVWGAHMQGLGLVLSSALVVDGNLVVITRAGWPNASLTGELRLDSDLSDAHALTVIDGIEISERWRSRDLLLVLPFILPLFPIWPGFAINTLFYAAILWLLLAAPFALRRRLRRRRGLCPACGYRVGESPVCTECGKPVTVKERPA